ncbi:MAG: DNA polymerase IV [Eubacteriales bacterium]|nr:DNA polymerase IV [Eubacteriales bacterium]
MSRTIFHIDANSAFLSWTAADMVERGSRFDPRLIPSVISGRESTRHGIVLAKSIPASRCGIKTGEPLHLAKKKCPELVVLPMSDNIYAQKSIDFYNLLLNFSPSVEQFSVDECFVDYSDMERFYGNPYECAKAISKAVKDNLGFTVNVGISTNKLLAKMASDFEKPDRIHELYPYMIKDKMWPLPVGDLFSVGKKTASKLNKAGILRIGDLAKASPESLRPILKSSAEILIAAANGLDLSEVKTEVSPPKSMSMSYTTPRDVNTYEDTRTYLITLCEKLCVRLREKNLTASGVTVNLFSRERVENTHQNTIIGHSNCTYTLVNTACELLTEMWTKTPIRRVGVAFWGLKSDKVIQNNVWTGAKEVVWNTFDDAADDVRRRFGESVLMPCSTLHNSAHNNTKIVAFSPEFSLSTIRNNNVKNA